MSPSIFFPPKVSSTISSESHQVKGRTMLLICLMLRFFALFLLLTLGSHHTTTVLVNLPAIFAFLDNLICLSASLSICNYFASIYIELYRVGNMGHTFVHVDCPVHYIIDQQADEKECIFSVFYVCSFILPYRLQSCRRIT